MLNPLLKALSCFSCGGRHAASALQTVCTRCGLPLRADYQLLDFIPSGPPTLWRYAAVLPIDAEHAVSLGEGFTPLLRAGERLWIKDEAQNPTGSFKARGMAVAGSIARALGGRALAAPAAGNAAGGPSGAGPAAAPP